MIAFIKSKKRLPYSSGGTGLILCYIRSYKNAYPIKQGSQTTHNVRGQTLPNVLHFLQDRIRCQDVDDTEVVNRIHRIIRFVCRLQTAFVRIEDDSSIVDILLWKTSCRLSMKRDTGTAVILRNAQRGKKGCYYSSAWGVHWVIEQSPASSRPLAKHVRFCKRCKVADGLDGVGADLGGWLGTKQ